MTAMLNVKDLRAYYGQVQALHGLELILDDLQLIDRLLLGDFDALGLFDKLLGDLRDPGLGKSCGCQPFRLRCRTGIAAPGEDAADPQHHKEKCHGCDHDRLLADKVPASALSGYARRHINHQAQSPKGD